jgi:hypothetical protein
MKKDLPLYELFIDPETDRLVSAVALVEYPAIESDFIAFAEASLRLQFNDDKMELLGAGMIPDLPIYRKDKDGYEYNVVFSKDTVREIAQQYFKSGFQANTNLHHKAIPAHSYIYQSFLVDESKGIKAPKGIDVPDGSWIVGVKVENADVWQSIKEGKVKGFSIEGDFRYKEVFENIKKQIKNKEDEELLQLVKQFINKIK